MRISDWSSDVCSSDLAKAYLGCIGPHGPPCSTFNEGVPPMIELRPFGSLGAANHGWLDAHHHFSFADYHDPARTNWGRLRVWNDDTIAPKTGFPSHPHRDMEIRSEEHTSELQSLMRISYAVFCLKKKKNTTT